MDNTLNFLYAAIKSSEDNVRGYDLKAQIVGIGYIFTTGVISNISKLDPSKVPFDSLTVVLSWVIGITPIILFGTILYPTRKTAPSLGDDNIGVKRLFFANDTHLNDVDIYLKKLESSDFVKELVYENLKLAALRDLKRKRFLRALWASVAAFVLIFISQYYRAIV